MAILFASMPRWAAGSGEVKLSEHLVPADKNLSADWFERIWKQEAESWQGTELATIGMPVGGIGAGQIYLCGDGTLGLWEIFNEHARHPHGLQSYVRRTIPKPVNHGLALYWTAEDGSVSTRRLDETGFPDVSFKNTHPIGSVSYAGNGPLEAQLEGFSPFIPLNADDSGLPTTFMVVTVRNTSDQPITVGTLSWLENPIARKATHEGYKVERRSSVVISDGVSRLIHSATGPSIASGEKRNPIVFQDFEGKNFGTWKVEGTAFGNKPTTGNLPTQDGVEGFEGKGFAGSFRDRDARTGRLTSPVFTVKRRYINFKIGGGNHPGKEGMVLLVDGKVVRTGTGRNEEKLIWRTWNVAEFEGKQAQLQVRDDLTDHWGHTQLDHIEFSDVPHPEGGPARLEDFPDYGSMAWGVDAETLAPNEAEKLFTEISPASGKIMTPADADTSEDAVLAGLATIGREIAPGQSKTFIHVLTWYFPNTVLPSPEVGHVYASRFNDAAAVLDYVMKERARLIGDTRKWRDTYYDSTLPPWLLERIHLTSCCLSTGTTMWWKNGRFWAWEGLTCCEGTCTHVYNYVQTVSRLFPELERNIREQQDLKPGVGLEPSGLVGFRHDGAYAADGQAGTILKVYREHKMSANSDFLKRNWKATKKVLDFAISKDTNRDGILEASQHNTYDVNFVGPNTFVGALHLAALRAGEEMAREMDEGEYAERLRLMYQKGRDYTEEKLWNGEWFFQQVNLDKFKTHQYGPGCLSDQMFGQNWAHQLGLGYLYDPAKVKKALESVYKYNWAPDLGPFNATYPPLRVFGEAAEAGLFNCTWPTSEHLFEGVLYREEVWTGVEYQVASHMVYEGMIDEAVTLCRAVHERYNPERRNPFNEIECSDFYGRAMASWGMLLALSGIQYHGPAGELTFAPQIQHDNFRCVFNSAEGWGTYHQTGIAKTDERTWEISVRHGKLTLSKLTLPGPDEGKSYVATAGAAPVQNTRISLNDGKLEIEFPDSLTIQAGESLKIT